MQYKEITTHTIQYSYDDIINWIQTFGARQLNITTDEISEDMIQITPDNMKDINITMTFTKIISNIKPKIT